LPGRVVSFMMSSKRASCSDTEVPITPRAFRIIWALAAPHNPGSCWICVTVRTTGLPTCASPRLRYFAPSAGAAARRWTHVVKRPDHSEDGRELVLVDRCALGRQHLANLPGIFGDLAGVLLFFLAEDVLRVIQHRLDLVEERLFELLEDAPA